MDVPNPSPERRLSVSQSQTPLAFGQPLPGPSLGEPEKLLFDFKGIPAGFINGPLRFGLADLQPQMPFMFINGDNMRSRIRIRREYPGLYPALEDEFQLTLDLYTIYQQAYAQSQNPLFYFFAAMTVFGQTLNSLTWMKAALASGFSITRSIFPTNAPLEPYTYAANYHSNDSYTKPDSTLYLAICLKSDQPLTEEARTFYLTVIKYVENFHAKRGFTWHYFMAVKENDPRVQARFGGEFNGNIPLTPEIFETHASDLEHSAEQITHLKKGGGGLGWHDGTVFRSAAPFIGWNRQTLLNAIKKSGLWDPDTPRLVPGGIGTSYNNRLWSCDNALKPPRRWQPGYRGLPRMITVNGGLLRSSIGLPLTRETLFNPFLAGLVKPTAKVSYYETIYRMMFNTLSYVNWETACSYPRISDHFLRTMAKDTFDIPVSATEKMRREELCTFLTQQGQARQIFTQTLKEHLPFQSQAIKLQPGSQWVGALTTQTQAQMGVIQITHPYERMVFIQSLCEDPNIGSLTVARKARQVGMGDLIDRIADIEFIKKADLCEFLLERLTADAERFGFIIVDCRNPAISKRHILQTVKEMGLEGIFKNVNTETSTKAEICAIVESYIQVLMENRALTLAQ